ncbi:MAG: ubiquitin-like protein Pup [Bifidobacterium mongoliense]|jgi:ubiquitin-like protein Pup|uniref:Prokaryotic ubiquitin-like protein Pup n=2 Tax=Bifidobacterium mongoliense TaxID=518643 RepID=A0A087CAC7_9BIFI|nr:ubiquitin-like protein Pup [Bifidobacterium mongoliense]KFI80227.1 ubiquitin-like protein Pup [Bifidobacterium mongoliense DSM 21395]MDN5979265.1 ubiquitin-like protein Pup [Bifidobacterium mongoliense]MDN6485729.1 ubiquitin-like protein Pup [Bifidobacterium mongoliense]MDN6769497.1 ubiquitin-like protein Pup [Bifidobacterium mongoliense]MDN6782749.1 ubiquitin-like protein Pup [Bifidobacterium mongoliense]
MPQQLSRGESSRSDRQHEQEQDAQERRVVTETQDDALDSVLDDIEATLETNAEEYVRSFVQQGGE